MEKTHFEFKAGEVPEGELQKVWKILTNKSFPKGKIRACVLPNDEAVRVFEILRKSPNVRSITIPEYGEHFEIDDKTDAGILIETHPDGTKGWMIMIKKEGHYTIGENLQHELGHIANGEIGLDGSAFGNKI